MAVKARLKFPGDLPFPTEMKLIHEGKFIVFSRKRPEAGDRGYIILEKMVPLKIPAPKIKDQTPPPKVQQCFDVLVNGELEKHVQDQLTDRCEKVVRLFLTPEAHQPEIRTRIELIAKTLPTKRQSDFVKKWMIENLDADEPLFLKRHASKDD